MIWGEIMNIFKDENEVKKNLIERLTYELPVLRARLGASQADIAEKIGVSRQTYNSIEKKKREMNWTTFMALIAVFQNNEETKLMIERIEGLGAEIARVMSLLDETER